MNDECSNDKGSTTFALVKIAPPFSSFKYSDLFRHSSLERIILMDQQSASSTVSSSSSSVRTWCMLAHATALVGLLVQVAGHIVGRLIIWLDNRHDSSEIETHGKESMSFQIAMLTWNGISAVH